MNLPADEVDSAADAIREGGLVIYPTETVYGLGADALSVAAIERVYSVKRRDRDNPLSIAFPDVEHAREYVKADALTRAFMDRFLPGPVTVICEKRSRIPDELTAGRDRVGVRIPDHPIALALLDRVSPITATSANRSGAGSARRVEAIDRSVRSRAVVLDGGETPGGESTVVDVSAGTIYRAGRMADTVDAWLSANAA